jgi:hypothetical protein
MFVVGRNSIVTATLFIDDLDILCVVSLLNSGCSFVI